MKKHESKTIGSNLQGPNERNIPLISLHHVIREIKKRQVVHPSKDFQISNPVHWEVNVAEMDVVIEETDFT